MSCGRRKLSLGKVLEERWMFSNLIIRNHGGGEICVLYMEGVICLTSLIRISSGDLEMRLK